METDSIEYSGDFELPRQKLKPDAPFLVKVVHTSETERCEPPGELELYEDDLVVVQTRYGRDLARVLGSVTPDNAPLWGEQREVFRKAYDKDVKKYDENGWRESGALETCRDLIARHGLKMKLVSAHFLLDEPKLMFFFTADGRVDFRDLVKDLVAHFRLRIELRQIGVRDEARVLGGTGVCGRTFCCHGLTDRLNPVSIKMAKLQNLSLNSTKISGPCGRLLCCLAYENEFYQEERKRLPNEGTRLEYDGTRFRITEVNVISQRVAIEGEDGRYMQLPVCAFRYNSGAGRWELKNHCPELYAS